MDEERGGFAPSSPEFARHVCEALKEPWREPEPKELPPADRKVAEALAQLNHKSRNKYWALRRRGVPEAAALEAVWRALPR